MSIEEILRAGYQNALKALVMGTSPRALARARERAFVKSLAAQFATSCAGEDLRVFSVYGRGQVADFGSERLLFDIEVCRVAGSSAAFRAQDSFFHVTEALWQIEIDMSQDWRQCVYALNRLRLGAGANKLLIAAAPTDRRADFLKTLANCGAGSADSVDRVGSLYLATMPHPRDWHDNEESLKLWRMTDGDWQAIL